MFDKYKDELLQERIDDMDQLDRIELRQKIAAHENVSAEGCSIIISFIFIAASYVMIPTINNLKLYGLEYSSHVSVSLALLLFAALFLIISLMTSSATRSKRKKMQENIDEFIRENAD